MRIGVLSDTHVHALSDIPNSILMQLSEVDLIVHAGDFTDLAVLEGLRELGEVKAVCGNMDSIMLKQILPLKEIFMAGGKRIGLVHGSGGPWDIVERTRQMFDDVDIIIYGHSHESHNGIVQGVLLFNPGPARKSFGILTIEDDAKGEIVRI